MRGLLGAEIDASNVQWLAVLNVLLGSVVVLMSAAPESSWVGGWASTAVFVSVYTCTIGGSLSCTAGWTLARDVRTTRRALLLRSVRPAEEVVGLLAIPAILWMSVSIAVIWCVALMRTYLINDYVRDVSVMVVLTVGATTALVALGFLLGTVLPRLAGLPISAIAPWCLVFVGDFVLMNGHGRWSQLWVFFVDQSWSPSLLPDRWSVLLYVGYAVNLALAIFAWTVGRFWSSRTGAKRWRVVWVPLVLAVVLGGILVVSWRPGHLTTPNSADLECPIQRSTVTVCLWPDQLYQLPAWQAAAEQYEDRLQALDATHVRVVPLGQATADTDREVALSGSPREEDILQTMLAMEVGEWEDRCRDEMGEDRWRDFVTTLLDGDPPEVATTPDDNSIADSHRLRRLAATCSRS